MEAGSIIFGGGAITFYGSNGLYIDGQAQAICDLFSSTATTTLAQDIEALGYSTGIEAGHRFSVAPGWTLTPQAQLVYFGIKADRFTDVFGAEVIGDTNDSFRTRLGLSTDYEKSWRSSGGRASDLHLYGVVNLYYAATDNVEIQVADVPIFNEVESLMGGVSIGGTYRWSDSKFALYAEGSVETGLEYLGDSLRMRGTAGLRISF